MVDAAPARLETAADHLARDVLTGRPEESVADVLSRLRHSPPSSLEALYVTDPAGHLTGQLPVIRLLSAPSTSRILELEPRAVASVNADTDQEHVASLAVDRGLAEVPVVDGEGRFLGVVPSRALIEVLRREHIEDMQRLVGILQQGERADRALQISPLRRLAERLPWLLVGLAGSLVATALMAGYEDVLAANLSVAFFVPALVYLADAIGTQTEAAAVRFLSFRRPALGPLLLGELATGLLIGGALALIVFPLVYLAYGVQLAAAVSLALVAAGTTATTTALLLPWALYRVGVDPAFGSGPVSTIVQDVLSLLVYFSTVSLIVPL